MFCGDCGQPFGDSGGGGTQVAVSEGSTSDTHCPDCNALRDPPDGMFCGDCGHKFF